jgi:predicted DNA-binding transcriptional regulator AlpA
MVEHWSLGDGPDWSAVTDTPSPPESELPDLVDVKAVAVLAGIRPSSVIRHITSGTIPTPELRIGNAYAWRRETIEEWLRTRRRPGWPSGPRRK